MVAIMSAMKGYKVQQRYYAIVFCQLSNIFYIRCEFGPLYERRHEQLHFKHQNTIGTCVVDQMPIL